MHVKDEKECRAYSALKKDHMSTDEDGSEAKGEGGWVSRPPSYRSRTITVILSK